MDLLFYLTEIMARYYLEQTQEGCEPTCTARINVGATAQTHFLHTERTMCVCGVWTTYEEKTN